MQASSFELKLARQLELEKIVSSIARGFVKIDNIDNAINRALQLIGEFSQSNRAYVFEINASESTMNNTYEWCQKYVEPEIDKLKNLPTAMYPWWMDKIKTGNILDIHDVSALDDSAKAEKELLEMQGIQSVLVLPIIYRSQLQGFVGFDNVESKGIWTYEDQTILGLAAEFFSNVFERILVESELTNINNNLGIAVDSLQRAHVQLFQQEQLVAIGQLAAGVAHEINNPLGFVLSNHSTLKSYVEKMIHIIGTQDYKKLDANLKTEYEYIKKDIGYLTEDIDTGLKRVKKIVEGLSFFSKMDSIDEFEFYDLNEGIKDTLFVVNYKITEDIQVDLKLDEQLPMMFVNGRKINQVILNLITNAVDAILDCSKPYNGKIVIETGIIDDSITLKIIDNGIGMTDEVKQHIFNPFFTTKPVGKGTGLGLNIIYDVIKNIHKGEIEIVSTDAVGTEIVVTLPLKE